MKKLFSRLLGLCDDDTPSCSAVVAAAGSSRRMGGDNKLMMEIGGIPVLARTLLALDQSNLVDEIVVAAREEDLLTIADLCKYYGVQKPTKIVLGGKSRQESVLAAALECNPAGSFIAVHDGARPLATAELIDRVISHAYRTNAAAPGIEVKDTVKVVSDGRVGATLDRRSLRCIQTPQVFDAQLLRAALQNAIENHIDITDDCSAVELIGKEIYLTEGSHENIKITTPEDILLAELILRQRGEL